MSGVGAGMCRYRPTRFVAIGQPLILKTEMDSTLNRQCI